MDEATRSEQSDIGTAEEFSDFFENAGMALHIVGADGTILRANKAELRMLGYTAAEYVGRRIDEFHADSGTIADILACLSRGESLDSRPALLRHKDGSVRHVLITSNALFRKGQFVHTRCITVDVTDQVHAHKFAEDSDRRFEQLLDSLPVAVYTTDADGFIAFYNQTAVELTGREPVIGKDRWNIAHKLFKPDGTPVAPEESPTALTLKENRAMRGSELVMERPDGIRVPYIPYPSPLHDADGKLIGAVNVMVDISRRRMAETRQRVLIEELNHRVKNNMQMLHALLTGAQRETTSANAKIVLGDAARRVGAMAAAQAVLYGAELPMRFDAGHFLDAVCANSSQGFGKKVNIVYEGVSGDLNNDAAVPLALILSELLTNAVKHGAGGGPNNQVRVGLTDDDGWYQLTVSDDGPGFDLPDMAKRSSGLGLVTGLVRQLGGTFAVERARTGGARAVVRFRQQAQSP
jgi:PAS domain S-box-containing protein